MNAEKTDLHGFPSKQICVNPTKSVKSVSYFCFAIFLLRFTQIGKINRYIPVSQRMSKIIPDGRKIHIFTESWKNEPS